MKDELQQKLQAMFAKDRERVEKVRTADDERRDREAAFLVEFAKIREEVIKPALNDVAAAVAEQGWTTEITESDEREQNGRGGAVTVDTPRITLSFFRGAKPNYYQWHEYPHFSVRGDKRAGKANFHTSTTGPGHGGSSGGAGDIALGEITADVIHSKVVEYIGKLLGDAKPYNQRGL